MDFIDGENSVIADPLYSMPMPTGQENAETAPAKETPTEASTEETKSATANPEEEIKEGMEALSLS